MNKLRALWNGIVKVWGFIVLYKKISIPVAVGLAILILGIVFGAKIHGCITG